MRASILALSMGLLAAVATGSERSGLPAATGSERSGLPAARGTAVEVGKPVPDFRVGTTGEKTVEARELRGKRVLVFFWASW